MRRGTTPTITFTLPVDASTLQAADITISNPGGAHISKSLEELTKIGSKLSIRLTQEETLRLRENSVVKIQCAIRLGSGVCIRSQIHEEPVEGALKGVPV